MKLVARRGRPLASFPRLSEKVVAINVHHLVLGSHKVTRELLLAAVGRVDLGQRTKAVL